MANVIVPTTKIRHYYEFLSNFTNPSSREDMAKSICASINNKTKLIDLIKESMKHFSKYCNTENFTNTKYKRKALARTDNDKKMYKNDKEVLYDLINRQSYLISNEGMREIDPRRATSSKYESGFNATGSGGGGIDFLAWDNDLNIPFIGEVKTRRDNDAFYALIQVLTYFTELSTVNQIERANIHNLFPQRQLKKNQKFCLGIIFSDYSQRSDVDKATLKNTKLIAEHVRKEIKQIHSIKFLNMERPFKKLEVL